MSKPPRRRRQVPLRAKVRNGVLTIEIGVDTLSMATLASPYAWEMADETTDRPSTVDPRTLYRVTNAIEFAKEVRLALFDEREDGSSLMTDAIDAATQKAIEDGSLYFADKKPSGGPRSTREGEL